MTQSFIHNIANSDLEHDHLRLKSSDNPPATDPKTANGGAKPPDAKPTAITPAEVDAAKTEYKSARSKESAALVKFISELKPTPPPSQVD